ncbi:hypothetical protein [Burkholderia anthina]|uniref:hypothetical protein n=1 Tax=Burkholderia anthina TaxID=179879 RepID=UPI00158CB429|nr:hypothetical protein [Burkholderia anthina]
MPDERTGYAVIAQMLGVETDVLRAIASQWENDPDKSPITWAEFEQRLSSLQASAEQLNNTNVIEAMIRSSLEAADIPPTLPTAGVQRFVVHQGGKPGKDET